MTDPRSGQESGQYVALRVTLVGIWQVPADAAERADIYGTSNVVDCVSMDFENDSASFMAEMDDARILRVDIDG